MFGNIKKASPEEGEVMGERDGTCCSCGYKGKEETPCLGRIDKIHCVHWWDGPNDESGGG